MVNKMIKSVLQETYKSSSVSELKKQFGYKNIMEVPKLEKVVISMGLKDPNADSKEIERAFEDLYMITGQKPVYRKAKQSIASFKIRKGMVIGLKVTLRKDSMWHFLFKLVNIVFPNIKDFRGLSPRQFDGKGNFSIGLREQSVFPEINFDKIDKIRGMNIAIVTTANSDNEARQLLKTLNFPFTN